MEYVRCRIEDNYNSSISIVWALTKKCNLTCWYCYQNHDPIHKDEIDYKYGITFIKKIINQNPGKIILLSLLGGEVLHYLHIDELLAELSTLENIKINITTNGTKSTVWWTKHRKIFDNIMLSYHHTQHNQTNFFNVCKTITDIDQTKYITIALMMDPNHFQEIYEYGLSLADNIDNLIINIKMLRQLGGSRLPYSNEQKEFALSHNKIRSKIRTIHHNFFGQKNLILTDSDDVEHTVSINQFILEEKHKFKGWVCESGVHSFFIDTDGGVFGANCLCKYLGNITQEVVFNNDPVICIKDSCNCRDDLFITKSKYRKAN